MRPPLVLTGPPGAGKTTIGRRLAGSRPRCAFIDTDDVRQLVVAGAAAPWEGEEGDRQRLLGAENAARLAIALLAAGFEAVVADVLTPRTAASWRSAVPAVLLVRLAATDDAVRAHWPTGHPFISEEERLAVHDLEAAEPPEVDLVVAVDGLGPDDVLAAVERAWSAVSALRPDRASSDLYEFSRDRGRNSHKTE